MNHLRRVFAFVAALGFVLGIVGQGQAQVLTPTLKITKAGIQHSISRTNNRNVTLLNRSDCESNDVMSFPVVLTNRASYTMQAWVGTSNCTDATLRQTTSQTQCWKVYDAIPNGDNQNAPTLQISVRSLIAGYTCGGVSGSSSGTAGAGGDTSSAGSTSAGTGGATSAGTGGASTDSGGATSTTSCITPINSLIDAGPEACVQNGTVAGATTLTLYIMLVDTSSQMAVASDSWVGTFKLVGPPPPDQVGIGIGGNLLVMNFKYSSQPADQTGNGYYLFCDPPPGRDSAVDAGLVEPDAGMGNTYTCGAPNSQVLIPGQLPPNKDSAYRCGGTASKSSQSANATNLVDGVAYNVAVAAYDTYDNTGPLSSLTCEVPQPVNGFFKAYQDAGGKGGGGFCAFSRHGEPLTLFAVLGFASYLVFRRRRAA